MPSFVPTRESIRRIVQTIFSTGSSRRSSSRASAGALNVDGGEDALLGQLAVEDELAVAGPLELFVNDVVHARPGVDQAGADDRERAALLDVSGGAEEALGGYRAIGSSPPESVRPEGGSARL